MHADVLIAGGGPAGLTAALVLARAGRSVIVCDEGPGRNAPAARAHNVFTREGAAPAELRRLGREQAEAYGARFLEAKATDARHEAQGLAVEVSGEGPFKTHRLLLATGVEDLLPALPGLAAAWGETVVHCPYCHGHELRGRPTVVLGQGDTGFEQARLLTGWTNQVTLLTDGPAALTEDQRRQLAKRGIGVREERVERVDVDQRSVRGVVFDTGERMEATALYLRPDQRLRGTLPASLNVELTEAGLIQTDEGGRTSVPGVSACGDAVTPMQMVQVAAAGGALAAAFLNHDLVAEGLV
ncbi:MAG: NAD(P)/FAD-dependent oxidoreductase [Bacteroidota bacterium]